MDLNKLFKAQAELDKRIVQEKGLQDHDLLDKKILALQVELGELANEWRGFKFWSEKQSPNKGQSIPIECGLCDGVGIDTLGVFNVNERCSECDGTGLSGEYHQEPNPFLEEYVDCLHFILSIGNDLNIDDVEFYGINKQKNEVDGFIRIYKSVVDLVINIDLNRHEGKQSEYSALFNNFIKQGELLGFTWEQIEQAYFEKNNTNHERQANGY